MATSYNQQPVYVPNTHQSQAQPFVEQSPPIHSDWTRSTQHLASSHSDRDESYELQQQQYWGSKGTLHASHVAAEPAEAIKSPSFFKSVPWIGLLSLVVTVLVAVGVVIVLLSADGKATDAWPSEGRPIQLSVILAILIALGNAALTLAFHEGTALTWWVKMLKGGNLGDSHRYWQHASSIFQCIMGLRHCNKVTFVSILMLFLIANPPLLQRAASFVTVTESESATFKAALSPDQLNQPTGYYMSHAPVVNALSSNFSQVVQDFTNRQDIKLDLEGCKGSCSGTLVGPGFDVSCTRGGKDYDLNLKTGQTAIIGTITVASNAITTPGELTVVTSYKADSADKGKLTTTNCTLHAAQVNYPFNYVNGTMTLTAVSSTVDGTVNRTIQLVFPGKEAAGLGKIPSVFGGIAYAIDSIYNSNVTVYSSGTLAIQGTGPMKYTYRNFTDADLGSKSMTWVDPTPAVLEAVREMTFRAAIAFSGASSEQAVQGKREYTTTRYKVNTKYLVGTLAIILFTTLAVIILYHGFWRLGRQVSMSPLEIATAFQAPVTQGAASYTADADEIAKQIGKREVRYRSIYSQDGTQSKAIIPLHPTT